MPRRLQALVGNASALISKARGLLQGTDAKEIEEIVDVAVKAMAWLEETVDTLDENAAVTKAMVLLDAGERIVELVSPVLDALDGKGDSSDTPSWLAVLIPLIQKLRASFGEQDD